MARQIATEAQEAADGREPIRSKLNWPEYLIEATCLGLFMVSCCVFGTLLEHPASPIRQAIDDPTVRRMLMGLAMGLSVIAAIYSPIGQRSGAHMNPSATLAFLRLGKIAPTDAGGYIAGQIVGGIVGVQATALILRETLGHPSVNHLATLPGPDGLLVAFGAELVMSCLLFLAVLGVSNSRRLAHLTGLSVGLLIMIFIVLEAPLSGMSINPARSLGSAVAAQAWSDLWIYFLAPPLGMLLAAELYVRVSGYGSILCAKLQHPRSGPCIFNCDEAAVRSRWPERR